MRKITIMNTSGLAYDTKIVDEETGVHLTRCTQDVVVRISPCQAVTAEVTLGLVHADFEGVNGRFYMIHPQTGDSVEVRSITLADGSVLEF